MHVCVMLFASTAVSVQVLVLWRATMIMATHQEKHLIEVGLHFQRLSPLLSQQEVWWHTGRHSPGSSLVFYTWICRQKEERERHWTWFGLLKNLKVHPSDTLSPTQPHLLQQIVPLPKHWNIWAYGEHFYSNYHNN